MVRILNGEIVQDDDPRLAPGKADAQRRPAGVPAWSASSAGGARHGPPYAPAAAPAPGAAFDFSQPPVRTEPRPGSLPDVVLYGFRVPGVGVAALLVAFLFGGWRAALLVGILGYVYLKNNPQGAGVAPQGGADGGSRSSSMGQQLQGAFAAAQQSFGVGSQQGSAGMQQHAAGGSHGSAGASSSTFRGKSYRLGSSN